jgi:hypothetical protein
MNDLKILWNKTKYLKPLIEDLGMFFNILHRQSYGLQLIDVNTNQKPQTSIEDFFGGILLFAAPKSKVRFFLRR